MYTCFAFLCEKEEEPAEIIAPPVGSSQSWGVYEFKPECQIQWEEMVQQAAISIADQYPFVEQAIDATTENEDTRPRLYDTVLKQWILIDTGASVSVFPKSMFQNHERDPGVNLRAVNGTRLQTYGKRPVTIKIGRKSYSHNIILTDVEIPILGWDFIKKYRLSQIWTEWGDLELVDKKANIKTTLRIEPVPKGTPLKLAPIEDDSESETYKTFQEWSQTQNQKATKKIEKTPIAPKYKALLEKYPEILKVNFKAKEVKHGVTHTIVTGTNTPCTSKPRPLMPGSPKAVQGEKNWRELEDLGITEPVNPEDANLWTSPLLLTPKPDGELRVCGDFRGLNGKTELDGYPLPNLKNFNGKIKGSTVFSKIDLTKAYHQIPLCPESMKKTTVVTQWGAWQFRRLPMGLRNSAQSFQRLIDTVLAGMENIVVYMDDILVYSKNQKEHMETLEEIFKRLEAAGLAINAKKCIFGQQTVEFVGYVVNRDGITPLQRKVDAIAKFPPPQKQKHLLGFLGALNYYRHTLPRFNKKSPAQILQPLYEAATRKMTRKSFTTIWEEEGLQTSYDEAKAMLMKCVQLAHPDHSAPIALTTDASQYAIGGVLEQFSGGVWQPLGFWSKHLKPDKQRWTTFRRELYALHQSVRHFQREIDGKHLVCFTDHKALLGAFTNPASQYHDPIASNHLAEVSMWTNDVRFIDGKSNAVADWLSRPPNVPMGEAYRLMTPVDALHLEIIDHKELAEAQKGCNDVKAHMSNKIPGATKMRTVEFSPGVELYCKMSADGCTARPLVPLNWRDKVIKMYHNLGHRGREPTLERVEARYYWPSMKKDVAEFVKHCNPCQQVKITQTIKPVIARIKVPDKRFSDLQVDVVGPMTPSHSMRYLFTVFDRTSRWVEAVPMQEANAKSCAMALIDGWIQRFGLPQILTSDNGNTFVAQVWKEVCKQLNLDISYTPPYHPSSLGGVERKHRDIKSGLKTTLIQMENETGDKWLGRLPWVMLACRTALQKDLGTSPAELVLGTTPTLPADLLGEPGPPLQNGQVKDILEGLRIKAARPAVQMSAHGTQEPYIPNTTDVTHVYVKKGKPGLLGKSFEGPFEIVERLGDTCIKVRVGTTAGGEPRFEVQHWNNVKPAHVHQGATTAERPLPGRKKLSPTAKPFIPTKPPPFITAGESPPPPFTRKESGETPYASTRPQRNRRAPERYQA